MESEMKTEVKGAGMILLGKKSRVDLLIAHGIKFVQALVVSHAKNIQQSETGTFQKGTFQNPTTQNSEHTRRKQNNY